MLCAIVPSKDASRPKSEIDLGGVRSAVPRALARRHRPDRSIGRAADHGRRARGPELSVLGGDGLSAHQHGRRPAVRKVRRPLRPQDRAAGGDRRVPHRLGAVRHRAEHAATDPVPRAGRDRWRRTDRHHHRRDRRPDPAARARTLSGLLRRGVRGRHHRRPAARRIFRRPPELALDLLHQSADRHPRDGRDRRRAAGAPTRRRHQIDYAGAVLLTPRSAPSSCSPGSAARCSPGTLPSCSRWLRRA